jgi:hypothetical protein
MKLLREDLELRRKVEILEIEERKNNHINELMKKHEKAFAEIKNYYNDITHNNLDLIKTLKVRMPFLVKLGNRGRKLGFQRRWKTAERKDGLAHPADASGSNRAGCLGSGFEAAAPSTGWLRCPPYTVRNRTL